MGILLSRFRKKKTTIEVLDELDKKIRDIEEYGQTTEQMHKKIVGTLIVYSVALYIIAAVIFYFYFFPAKFYDQLFYITPLLLFPILILFTKRGVSWYYKRKISRNQEKLQMMQKEKKKILEEVTETETYKKAKEILMKFAPDQLRMTPLTPQQNLIKSMVATPDNYKKTPQMVTSPVQAGNELRRRILASTGGPQAILPNRITGPITGGSAPGTPTTPYRNIARITNTVTPAQKTPLPRPVLPQQRTYVDRLVEYVVGDGPNNRYALICRQCDSHNGMSLKEEFEYFAFRCCYCNFWNPARKQKPPAPKLLLDDSSMVPRRISLEGSGGSIKSKESDLENDVVLSPSSDSDSDIEVVEKPHSIPRVEDKMGIKEEHEDEVRAETNEFQSASSRIEKAESQEKMEVDESPKKI